MTDDDSNTKKPLLVIGGGPSGITAISNFRQFDKQHAIPVILVEPKDYVEITWATYRTPFDPALADASLLELAPWCAEHNVQHMRACVTALTDTVATLDNATTIAFATAVICTGATCPWAGLGRGPLRLTKAERLAQLQHEGDVLRRPKVAVVGGGLIGVELAGDLADYAADTTAVTLIHSGPHLCHADCSKGCGNMLQKQLEELGVKVILNEKAEQIDGGKLKLLKSGEELDVDQVVMTIGMSSASKGFVDAKYLNEKGWIVVDESFRVKGSKTLMSVGDACTFLYNAANQVFTNKEKIGFNVKQVYDENTTGKCETLKNGASFHLYVELLNTVS